MTPITALALCLLFILYVYIEDIRRHPGISHALWVPLLWFLIIGSRPVSMWLNMGLEINTPDDYLEGSPLDASIFALLEIVGLLILGRRKIKWSLLCRRNLWIFLFFVYCAVSIFWSEFPFVSFKRYIKQTGTLVMALVVLTEPENVEAIKALLRRWAYALLPLSVLTVKYFPDIGRAYERWNGVVSYSGVGYDKNALGCLCLTCGLFFVWNIITLAGTRKRARDSRELYLSLLFLGMILWLMHKANSATSVSTLIVGVFVLAALGLPWIKRNLTFLGTQVALAGILGCILFVLVDVPLLLATLLNRDTTLTGRTQLWETLMGIGANPWVGTGYETFWLGSIAKKVWNIYWWRPIQAHNGYLEIYLNLGALGLILICGLIIEAYRRGKRSLFTDFAFGRLQLAFLCVFLIYNITEASFKGLHPMLFLFLLIEMRWPRPLSNCVPVKARGRAPVRPIHRKLVLSGNADKALQL